MSVLGEHQTAIYSYFVGFVILAPLLAAAVIAIAHALENRRERRRQRREQEYIKRLELTMR
jgi:hypothetical protein